MGESKAIRVTVLDDKPILRMFLATVGLERLSGIDLFGKINGTCKQIKLLSLPLNDTRLYRGQKTASVKPATLTRKAQPN
jgi:hypothetical protein